jgi:hypothetical protein
MRIVIRHSSLKPIHSNSLHSTILESLVSFIVKLVSHSIILVSLQPYRVPLSTLLVDKSKNAETGFISAIQAPYKSLIISENYELLFEIPESIEYDRQAF